jgi:hypothetical protein
VITNRPTAALFADSFDSANGPYQATQFMENGTLACLFGRVDLGSQGGIHGDLSIGPAVTFANPIQISGKISKSLSVDFADLVAPTPNWLPAMISNYTNNGIVYRYAFQNSGDYSLGSSGNIYVGHGAEVRLKITAGSFNAGAIRVAGSVNPGKLAIYMSGSSFTLSGDAVVDSGKAANFNFFGLPGNTTITLTNSVDFTGTLYAPKADLKIFTTYHDDDDNPHHHPSYYDQSDFTGSCTVNSLTLTGRCRFHFDEGLLRSDTFIRGFLATSWHEL